MSKASRQFNLHTGRDLHWAGKVSNRAHCECRWRIGHRGRLSGFWGKSVTFSVKRTANQLPSVCANFDQRSNFLQE
eukprot:1580463-Rhodomonas_salina.2